MKAKQIVILGAIAVAVMALLTWNDSATRANGGRYDAAGQWKAYGTR
jgi:hypothetical protein